MSKIYNANLLRSGLVVYLTKDFIWSEHATNAILVDEDDMVAIQACEQEGLRAVNANEIVEPYWVETQDDGKPLHMRERMRAEGPTMRTDK